MNRNDIIRLISKAYEIEYTQTATSAFVNLLTKMESYLDSFHPLNLRSYKQTIALIKNDIDNLSTFKSDSDRLLHKKIQKSIANLYRQVLDENKKIFIVHGRNLQMRDAVCSALGRLKLDPVILENEHNSGSTIIEKFLRNAEDCGFAIVLFSADDLCKLVNSKSEFRYRVRQNVVLELGFFLCKIGRKNILILHEMDIDIEQPTDFSGIVYEGFDQNGAWKTKLTRELKSAGIYIDQKLADKL